MKMKKFIAKHTLTIVITLSLLTIGILINWVEKIADDATIDSTYSEIEKTGIHYQILLSSALEAAHENILLIAEDISKNNIDGNNVLEYFSNQLFISEFNDLYYVELDGNGVSVNNKQHDFSQNESFLHALNNELYIENPQIDLETASVIFSFAVPVLENGEARAVLFCEISVDDFLETMISNQGYGGDLFFIDNNLNLIFSTSSNHNDSVTIPEEDVEQMGIDNVLQAKSDIENKQRGGFYYVYFDTPKVMVYYPIELTDIALAINVQVSSISHEFMRASTLFGFVGRAIYWTVISLIIYITYIQSRSNKRIMKVAYFDPLTELPNTAKLKLEMSAILESNKKKNYTILVIDIENFKAINEMFGYDIGDRVLKTVKSLSESFNEPSLITARIGSDKFAMFAGNSFFDDLNFFAIAVDSHYNELIPELTDYGGSFKIGRYHIELGETNFDDIMAKVNLAHVKAKTSKGEFFCDYDDTLKNQVLTEADITSKMKNALANNEFKVFLQPKFSTDNTRLVGAEALVRWIEADGKMIYPNDFIPLFERNGFIVELDNYILENVCKTLRRWIDLGLGQITISVNCSRLNLENPFLVDSMIAIADKYQVPHEYIEIELTESTTIESAISVEKLFEDLHNHGFKISIDDFGAGQSSLGMLKNLHIDTLKMDRSFFVGGKNMQRDDMLIDSIVKMSHNLGMYVVAEGIETAEQIELLKSMNCDAIQGYFYDKPMPIDNFEQKYSPMMSNSDK